MPVAVAQEREIPKEIRALDAIGSDYVDVFTASGIDPNEATPEEWARAALDDAPAVGRFLAWRTVLGLRLDGRSSRDLVAGWRVAGRGESWIRLEASSWFMTANIVFRTDVHQVSFATFVRYDRRIAAAIWTSVSAVHRRVAPDVLRAAVLRIERRRSRTPA